MAGEVSCRAVRPLFRYLNDRNLSLAQLVAGLPAGNQDFVTPENWIPAALFDELLDQAALLSGDPDLTAHVGEAASDPCPFGPLSAQAVLAGSPEALLERAGDFLGLLQRDSQIVVRAGRPGHIVIEWLPPAGGHRGYHVCTYARNLLRAIPHLWQAEDVQVHEAHCAVPPAELRLPAGSRCTVDAEGNVWEVPPQGSEAMRLRLGRLEADGSFAWEGTCYGADRCVYEITWPTTQARWRQVLARLHPLALLREPLFRRAQRQQQAIHALREQIHHLNLTIEARVLERTEELRVKARQMALVEQASRRFAAILEPEALFREAVRTLREEFGYYTVALYLLEGEEWLLRALDTGDNTARQQPGPAVRSQPRAVERLQRAGHPLVQEDVAAQAHPLGLPALGRGRASMTAPLIASSRFWGVLDVQNPRPGRFDQDDALILHALATQVALSLERSQLYREDQRARQRADAMAVLARVVNTSLELDQVLSLALDQLRRVLSYDAAAVLLLEEDQRFLAAKDGLPAPAEQALSNLFDPEKDGPLARTLQEGEPLLIATAEQPGGAFPPPLAFFASWLTVPLTSRGTVVGAFVLAARQPRAYGQEDLRTAEDFAGQVATAIENARLYNRIRQDRDRLESLYGIAGELNADLEIEEVLRHILDLAEASVGAAGGSIILLDDAGRPTHSIILRPSQAAAAVLQAVLSRGAAGWVTRTQQGLLIRDTQEDSRWITLPDDPTATRSAIVVPLIGQGRVIGVLTVIHPQAGRFDPDDLALLSSIAEQASSVVQRTHLFAAIRDERARLETVIEGTADAVIVLDEEGQVRHINRSAAGLFGAIAGDREALHHSALQVLLRAADKWERQRTEVPLADGRTFYATLSPIPGVGAVITMQDITYLKELDRMKSDFVAAVSHDLRTPLGALQGYAEMMEVAGPLNEDQTLFVQRIIHTIENMSDLVGNLLDLAKIEAGVEMEMAPCQLAAVIAESVDQLTRPAAMKPVSLQVEVPEDLPMVWGNGRRLGQVVNNLLDNAIKYAPANGHVTLHAGIVGSALRVDFSDDGPGITAADLPHIFEKFFRTHESSRRAPGTGLGLSIAHSIIQAHGGRIWAESKEREGTTFSFSVPLWTDSN